MNREFDPATERQLALVRDLGLRVPPGCTVAQASDLIGLTQIVRHYAIFVARQEWHADIADRDLRAVIREVMERPEIADDIQEIMDAYTQAAWVNKDELDRMPAARKAPDEPPIFLDLREDETYRFVETSSNSTCRTSKPFTPSARCRHRRRPKFSWLQIQAYWKA